MMLDIKSFKTFPLILYGHLKFLCDPHKALTIHLSFGIRQVLTLAG